jgi:hypothetical protein
MAVYKHNTMNMVFNTLKNIASRLLDEYQIKLTSDEFIKAFIRPEHVEPLMQTKDLVGTVLGDTYFTTKLATSDGLELYSSVSFGYSRPPIIVPEYCKMGLAPTAPDEIKARITEAVDERVRLGRMFGDAIDALYYLNDNSGNAAAMAVLFPALPTLLAASDPEPDSPNAKRAAKLANMKSFGTVATLPREVRLRILECSSLIMNTTMLPEKSSNFDMKSGEAKISVACPIKDLPDFIQGDRSIGSFV